MRHAQHEARHATVPTQVCVAAVSQTLTVGQKVRTGCVPCIPSSAVLHPRYGMEATPSVSFPQVGFLQLSCGFLNHCVSHCKSMSRKTRASLKPGDAGHRGVSIRYVVGYIVGYGNDWYCCGMYSTISQLLFSVSLFLFLPFLHSRSVSLLVSFHGRFTFLACAGRGSWREFLWCSCGFTQSAFQIASLNKSLDAAFLAESSSSSPEACKSLLGSFPFSATVFAQDHSCSDSLNLQIKIQSTL